MYGQADVSFTPGPADPTTQLYAWMQANVSSQTSMPLSFDIADANRANVYANMGEADCVGGVVERVLVEEGINIYDGSVWQLALIARGSSADLNRAEIPVQTYWAGGLGSLSNIRAGYGASQNFVYDVTNPTAVSSDLTDTGTRGFIFRMLNAHGDYYSADPLDGKTTLSGFPNGDQIHWEDWKPIAGENAWVTMAASQLHHAKYFDSQTGTYNVPSGVNELNLAEELARAAILLQTSNGGIRMAPQGTFRTESGPGTPCIPSGSPAADAYTWYHDEIATENNISWYAAFRMLYQITGKNRIPAGYAGH